MYRFPDVGLGLLEVIEREKPEEVQSVYLWQSESAFEPSALPSVQIEMLPGTQYDVERTDVAAVTVWTAGDLQQASRLARDLEARLAERPHSTTYGLLDTIVIANVAAPSPTDVLDVVRYTGLWEIDTRAQSIAS